MAQPGQTPPRGTLSRSPVLTRGGVVASAAPLAASAGIRVLQEGGNAFDAAIATAALECVCLPPLCGLGGEVFAILYEAKSGQVFGLNSSGAAPRQASPQLFWNQGYKVMPAEGPHSCAVPGEVAAYEAILGRFGTRKLSDLLEPAIGYAEEGFPLPAMLGKAFHRFADKLRSYASTARALTKNGEPYQPGEVLVQKDLARSLRRVAQGGADEFYRGETALEIVQALQSAGGLHTREDFAEHAAELYQPPLSTTYRGYTVYETRPPSQGFLVLEMLNLLEGFDLASLGPLSADAIHLMVEAKKLAFADRNVSMGDPKLVQTPLEELVSKEYAARRKAAIDPHRAKVEVSAGLAPQRQGETSYFCVVDAQGNAVSFIHSLFHFFGSGFIAGNTGILLNSRGRGFSLAPGHPNLIAPSKRPMHTLNCYMVARNGRPFIVGGTPGGDFQPQGNVQIITDLLDFGLDVQEAVEAPRWHSFPGTDQATLDAPPELHTEPHMPEETIRKLEAKGHSVAPGGPGMGFGVVQLIRIHPESGVRAAASDPRSDGHAVAH